MKLKYCILSLLFFYLNISSIQAVIPQMEVSPDERGVSSLVFQGAGNVRNYVDHGKYLGDFGSYGNVFSQSQKRVKKYHF